MANIRGCMKCEFSCRLSVEQRETAFAADWECPYGHYMHDQEIAYNWHIIELLEQELPEATVQRVRDKVQALWEHTAFMAYCAAMKKNLIDL